MENRVRILVGNVFCEFIFENNGNSFLKLEHLSDGIIVVIIHSNSLVTHKGHNNVVVCIKLLFVEMKWIGIKFSVIVFSVSFLIPIKILNILLS